MQQTRNFTHKELDAEGLETLQTISDARRFNGWMHEILACRLLPGQTLEVGSGIGNLSRCFLDAGTPLFLSDLREGYCGHLEEAFAGHPALLGILRLDLAHPQFDREYAPWFERFDNLFALNVIEHIEDDAQALANCAKLLRPGGRALILVPAFQSLYNRFDEALLHYRRYTRSSLSALFPAAGLAVRESFYFNAAGILGWWFSGSLMGKSSIPRSQMRLYDRLVPAFRLLDRLLGGRLGLSVVVVAEKEA